MFTEVGIHERKQEVRKQENTLSTKKASKKKEKKKRKYAFGHEKEKLSFFPLLFSWPFS